MSVSNLLELVMIVKNSGDILRECLRSIKPYISKWTILDTGSKDDTPDIIKEEMIGVPGSLFFEDFIDFSTSRNRSLDLACSSGIQCKYQIILDDSYVLHGGENLLKILTNSKKKSFNISINSCSEEKYYSLRIIKTSCNYRYINKIHEIINTGKDSVEILGRDFVYIKDVNPMDHKTRTMNRLKSDIILMKTHLEEHKDDTRMMFHLSMTLKLIGDFKGCLKYLEKMVTIKNLHKEYEFSSLYNINILKYYIIKNDCFLNDKGFFKKMYDLSVKFPERSAECLYHNARILYENGDFITLLSLLKRLILFKIPDLSFTFVPVKIYKHYIPYLYINCLLKLGIVDQAVENLKKLMDLYPSNQPLLNIKYSICEPGDSIKLYNKVIVIHTGNFNKTWNPVHVGDYSISGSEYMALNIAKEFSKINWRVFVFGDFGNFECVENGIQYIDKKKFIEFYEKYKINVLIVSRFLENLVYHDNIEKVYLWCHDVIPMTDTYIFQTHPTKFGGIIVLSKWQKNIINEMTGIPENKIILSRNAIYSERFDKKISKIPYQFIYSANYSRGLPKLVEMIQKIKKIFPETTLKIFTEIDDIPQELMNTIKSCDYISLNPRVSQEQISQEYLESDIWLYPTDFKETYCITALEAMRAGCLVACTGLAGLKTTVSDRGLTVKLSDDYNEEDYNKTCDELLKKLEFVLKNPELKNYYVNKGKEWAETQTYESLVQEWLGFINF